MKKQTNQKDELEKLFGKGKYTIVKDAQAISRENSRKMEELIKTGKVHPEFVEWFSKEDVKASIVKWNGHNF